MIAARPWGLPDEAWSEVLRALRFEYFKWDTWACGECLVLPEMLVISRELHEEAVRVAEGLHRALVRFEERVRRDPARLDRLGVPRPLHRLISREPARELQIARYDLFPTPDGRLMVSEFNEDVPGGFNEAHGLPRLLGTAPAGTSWVGDLREAFVRAMEPWDRVALLYATAFSEDLQHMLILERWLEEEGHDTLLASPAHLRRSLLPARPRTRILGSPVDAAFRFFPGEWMPRLPNFRSWERAAPELPMMNPVYRMVRQSKAVFGVWLEDPELDAEDRALVERHCPRTFPFDPRTASALREERDRWVLKRAFGRMGDSVVMGNLVTDREWDEAVREASKAPADWSVQERFDVRSFPFEAGELFPALGVFLVNGRFAGYYSRAARRPFLTHEAFHVATLVEVPTAAR